MTTMTLLLLTPAAGACVGICLCVCVRARVCVCITISRGRFCFDSSGDMRRHVATCGDMWCTTHRVHTHWDKNTSGIKTVLKHCMNSTGANINAKQWCKIQGLSPENSGTFDRQLRGFHHQRTVARNILITLNNWCMQSVHSY